MSPAPLERPYGTRAAILKDSDGVRHARVRGTARSGCADGSVLFSGGGQQRWWDPAWRAQRLSELGEGGNRKYIEVDTVALTARFSALRASGGGEVQLRENYGPHGAR